jgi:hypothetical protein
MPRLNWIACLMAVIGALALPTAALAAGSDPTTKQYANSLTGAQNAAGGSHGASNTGSGSVAGESGSGGGAIGGLPFTGTDLVALAAVALCLIGTGLVFQRLAARSQ